MKELKLEERVAALEKHLYQLIFRVPSEATSDQLRALSQATLEERVAALEKHIVTLLARLPPLEPPKDWRSTVGMFAGDAVMKEIDEAGRKIREEDRRRTKREFEAKDRKAREAKRRRARQ